MNEDKIVEYLARMFTILVLGLIVAVLISMCGCTRTIYVPQVSVERDSIYLHTHSRDSIYLHDSILIREKGDTVWMERWHTTYKDRLLTDTIYIERHDSVVVPYPVEKKLTTMQKAWIKVGKISAGTLACAIVALLAYILALRKR